MVQSVPQQPRYRWMTAVAHLVFRFTRPMTLGVRAVVKNHEGGVLLVRHTYVPGWHLPGGGVEVGETLEDALVKELREEGNIVLDAPATLFGIYFNRHVSKRDHVAVYLVDHFHQTTPRIADHEIAETGFFALDNLPTSTTSGTRRRLAEVFEGRDRSQDW